MQETWMDGNPGRMVNLDDLELRAEYDENVVRGKFSPIGGCGTKEGIGASRRARAKQRRIEGVKTGGRGHKKLGEKSFTKFTL